MSTDLVLVTGAGGNVLQGIYLTTRLGMAARVTPEAAEVLRQPTISMRQYSEDYASVWSPQGD